MPNTSRRKDKRPVRITPHHRPFKKELELDSPKLDITGANFFVPLAAAVDVDEPRLHSSQDAHRDSISEGAVDEERGGETQTQDQQDWVAAGPLFETRLRQSQDKIRRKKIQASKKSRHSSVIPHRTTPKASADADSSQPSTDCEYTSICDRGFTSDDEQEEPVFKFDFRPREYISSKTPRVNTSTPRRPGAERQSKEMNSHPGRDSAHAYGQGYQSRRDQLNNQHPRTEWRTKAPVPEFSTNHRLQTPTRNLANGPLNPASRAGAGTRFMRSGTERPTFRQQWPLRPPPGLPPPGTVTNMYDQASPPQPHGHFPESASQGASFSSSGLMDQTFVRNDNSFCRAASARSTPSVSSVQHVVYTPSSTTDLAWTPRSSNNTPSVYTPPSNEDQATNTVQFSNGLLNSPANAPYNLAGSSNAFFPRFEFESAGPGPIPLPKPTQKISGAWKDDEDFFTESQLEDTSSEPPLARESDLEQRARHLRAVCGPPTIFINPLAEDSGQRITVRDAMVPSHSPNTGHYDFGASIFYKAVEEEERHQKERRERKSAELNQNLTGAAKLPGLGHGITEISQDGVPENELLSERIPCDQISSWPRDEVNKRRKRVSIEEGDGWENETLPDEDWCFVGTVGAAA